MKAIIVNRVSSTKQNPELQLKDCLIFCERKNLEVIKTYSEIASAGKSKQKQIYEAEQLAIKEGACIVVWKYDRSFRNKKDFAEFMLKMFELYNIKVYSVQEEWVSMLWDMTENIDFDKIPYPFNESMKEQFKSNWRLMIKVIGKMAEDEIKDKGSRVRNAVIKKNGKTLSYKGNVWGRKKSLSKNIIKQVLELKSKGLSLREIRDSVFYYDNNRNRKNISLGSVQKIVAENHSNNILVKEGVH